MNTKRAAKGVIELDLINEAWLAWHCPKLLKGTSVRADWR